jgi:hypothetical protein
MKALLTACTAIACAATQVTLPEGGLAFAEPAAAPRSAAPHGAPPIRASSSGANAPVPPHVSRESS